MTKGFGLSIAQKYFQSCDLMRAYYYLSMWYSTARSGSPLASTLVILNLIWVSKGFQRFIHNPSQEVCTELKTNSSSVIHEQNRGYTKRHGHTRRKLKSESGDKQISERSLSASGNGVISWCSLIKWLIMHGVSTLNG